MKNRVLVPVTPSDISRQIVKIADDWGKETNSELFFLHAIKTGSEEKNLESLEKVIGDMNLGSDYRVHSYLGTTYQGILEEEKKRDPDFILMAAHSHTLLKRLILGSVSEYILHNSEGPIWFFKQPKEIPKKIIIVPLDYSEINVTVIGLADDYARFLGAELVFIHVFTPPPKAFYNLEYVWEVDPRGKDDRRDADRVRNVTREEKERLNAYLAKLHIKSRYRQAVEYGKSYLHILELQRSTNAMLVMMASHSHTMTRRTLPGSITKYVLQNGSCSVFVYKE
ncbi:MAG: universal stress protein [Proteobacteria bacterium]|nr:universal stress protein [Pseudomonadota bacterium]